MPAAGRRGDHHLSHADLALSRGARHCRSNQQLDFSRRASASAGRVRKRDCEFGPGGIREYSMASDSDAILHRGAQVSLSLREVGSWARCEQLHAVAFDRLLQASRLGIGRYKTQDGWMSTFGRVKDTRASGRFIETIYQRVVQRFGEKEEPHLTAKRLQGANCGGIAIRAKNRTSALQQFRYARIEVKARASAQLIGCE